MLDMTWIDALLLAVSGLASLATLFSFVWRSWALLTEDDVNFTSILAVVTPCLCFPLVFLKTSPRTRTPDRMIVGGIVVTLLCAYPIAKSEEARRKANRAKSEEAARQVAIERASRLPSRLDAPGAPQKPVVLPPMGGKAVDLSSVMGRARALANAWQPEAALLGIEASGLARGVLQTDSGAAAKLTFGPPSFGDPGAKTGTFIVTYDKSGLSGAPSTAKAGKLLVEPMCAPERVYDLFTGSTGSSITLRYGRDAQDQPAWLASDPAVPKQKPQAFDAQSCTQLHRR